MSLLDLVATHEFKSIIENKFIIPRLSTTSVRSANSALLDHQHLGKAIDFFIRSYFEKITAEEITTERNQIWTNAPHVIKNSRDSEEVIGKSGSAFGSLYYYKYEKIDDGDLVRALLDISYMDSISRSYPDKAGLYALQNLIGKTLETQETRDELLFYINETLDYIEKPKQSLITGPSFGGSGRLLGGADADLIADGILYDVKFTQSPTPAYLKAAVYQLLGYTYLNKLEGFMNGEIHSIGIILPRQRETKILKLAEISKSDEILAGSDDIERLIRSWKIARH